LDAIESIKQPSRRECEECVKIGDDWVLLRTQRSSKAAWPSPTYMLLSVLSRELPILIAE
jgi:hypothetical protein